MKANDQSVMTLVLSVPLPDSSLTPMISSVVPDSSEVLSSLTTERLSVSSLRTLPQRVCPFDCRCVQSCANL